MLILSRKEEESVKIGEDIEIKIVQTAKGYVKIGIDAPKSLLILRKELLDDVKDKNLLSVEKKDVSLTTLSDKIKK